MSDADVISGLTRWFKRRARPLPWRVKRSGYSALVAEAMLQQTQVSRVVEPFARFMACFANVGELAAADEHDVLAHWQGLGYYRRARQLHAAARMIVDRFGGRVPRDAESLRELPGVGRYTSGAIASIVYGRPEPIADGNVQRVLARLHAKRENGKTLESWAWSRAAQLVVLAPDPGVFNEAMMEFGSTICTPRAPRCDDCPIAKHCRARSLGVHESIPSPKPKPKRTTVHHHAVIIRRSADDAILLERRPSNGLWASMWQTPTVESQERLTDVAKIAASLPVRVRDLELLGGFEHQTSHRRVMFHVYAARSRARAGCWRNPADTADLPMSNAHRKVLAMAVSSRSCAC